MANTFAQAYVDEDTEAFNKYLVPNSENLVDNFTTGAAVYKRYVTKYDRKRRQHSSFTNTSTMQTA